MPDMSYTRISREEHSELWNAVLLEEYTDCPEGILIYYGHNHRGQDGAFITDTITSKTSIQHTAHGVLASRHDSYVWLFMSNGSLTGTTEKLRWPSIHATLLNKDIVIIHQVTWLGVHNQFFAVDLKSGAVGQIHVADNRLTSNSPHCVHMSIDKGKLNLWSRREDDCYGESSSEATLNLPLNPIKRALRKSARADRKQQAQLSKR